jgi:hypothetical protein
MAYTSADLENLRQAIAEGVQRVRFSDGRELTYRSLDEMHRIEAKIVAELSAISTSGNTQHFFTPRRMS